MNLIQNCSIKIVTKTQSEFRFLYILKIYLFISHAENEKCDDFCT